MLDKFIITKPGFYWCLLGKIRGTRLSKRILYWKQFSWYMFGPIWSRRWDSGQHIILGPTISKFTSKRARKMSRRNWFCYWYFSNDNLIYTANTFGCYHIFVSLVDYRYLCLILSFDKQIALTNIYFSENLWNFLLF